MTLAAVLLFYIGELPLNQLLNKRDSDRAGKARRGAGRAAQSGDSEFINLELDKTATEDYRAWREDSDHIYDVWTALLEDGYRVNTKFDSYSDACAAFIIPSEGSANAGYILTGRGGNAYRAVSEALYKHEVVLLGTWGAALAQRRGHDDPDF